MILRARLVSAAAVAFGFWAPQAVAAEAYLCGPDTIVYVEVENLEAMKRTDPCIAGYYGLKVEPKAAAVPAVTITAPVQAKAVDVAPATMKATPTPASISAPTPKPAPPLAVQQAVRDLRPLIAAEEPSTAQFEIDEPPPADAAPVVAAVGTDFRNVRVINAHAPEDMWFRHVR